MPRLTSTVLAALGVFAFLAAAPAPARAQAQKPPVNQTPAYSGNFAPGTGNRATLDYVVIHKAEGSQASAVGWFQSPASHVSAHYVIGHDGSIDQCVQDADVAWHAGNHTYNLRSIGIEHSGFSAQADTTDAQYTASAQLVAWLCTTYQVPIDRAHVVGHQEVPDPNHPGQFGGANHHTGCPGHNWDWPRFMALVQQFAAAASSGGGTTTSGGTTTPPAPGAQTLPFADSFDGRTTLFSTNVNGLFFIDDPSRFAAGNAGVPLAAASPPHCVGTIFNGPIAAGVTGALFTPELDLAHAASPRLSCQVFYDFFDGLDGTLVAGSKDGGKSWVLLTPASGYPTASIAALGTPGFSGRSGGWLQCDVDLAPLAGSATVYVAFLVATDATSPGSAGFFLDDVLVHDGGASALPQTGNAFIDRIAPGAVASMHATGVPASVTIAQAILESGWGRSRLAAQYHNLFGMKAHAGQPSVTLLTQEFVNGKMISVYAKFRVYASDAESIADHGDHIAHSGYYTKAMSDRADANKFARDLTGIYATAPNYGASLIRLMTQYNLYIFNNY